MNRLTSTDRDTRVLAALRHVHSPQGHAILPDVIAAAGLPHTTVWRSLCRLRALGLADWDEDHRGTLRPTWPTPPPPRLPDGTVDVREYCRVLDAHCNQGPAT